MISRLTKLLISLVVYLFDRLRSTGFRLVGVKLPPTCVVLDYHSVPKSSVKSFAWQMDILLKLAKPISAGHSGRLESGGYYCSITFDDGFLSVLENAIPILQQRGIPATIFLPTGSLGRKAIWMAEGESNYEVENVLSVEQLEQFRFNRLVTIGAHSVTHPNFLKVSEVQAREEFQQSRLHLERIVGHKVDLFSFPYGAYDNHLVELARVAGYKRVFTIESSLGMRTPSEFVTGRVVVNPSDWSLEFKLKLFGSYRWLVPIGRLKRKLIKK